jgi:type II secretory pathway pseudopilin PulG
MYEKLAALVIAAVALVFAGYQWGSAAHEAEARKTLAAANLRYQKEVTRGQEASKAYATNFGALQDRFTDLGEKFNELNRRRAPLVRARGPAGVAPGTVASAPPTDQASNASPSCAVVVAVPEPVLTAGAVWMWNSALAGRDVPSDTCGSADTSESACDVGTDITVEDAWNNHTTNAKACAADRLRHQSLIDYLQGRKR